MEPWLRAGNSSGSSLNLIMLHNLQVSIFSLLCFVFPTSAEYTQLQYLSLSALLVFSVFIMWPDLPTVLLSFHGSEAVLNTNCCTWQVECGAISSAQAAGACLGLVLRQPPQLLVSALLSEPVYG